MRNHQTVFKKELANYIPTNSAQSPSFFTFSQLVSGLVFWSHPGCEVVAHMVVLVGISLVVSNVEHLSSCSSAASLSFGGTSVRVLCPLEWDCVPVCN